MKYVNLHSHSLSIFDAIGYPEEHMRFVAENGGDAMAITDHGHMNALPWQIDAYNKLKAEGKNIKCIFGSEVYFLSSIAKWREQKTEHDKTKKTKKADSEISVVVENEGETKSKQANPLNRREHLVLLAQNQDGLRNLFKLISDSYRTENFYRFPRMDFEALKNHNEGLIALSACLGGVLAKEMWAHREDGEEVVYDSMKAKALQFQEIFGDRFYGEIQFNNIPEQHILNKLILRLHKEINLSLVATADSHYPNPNAWKDRELYKRLGWMSKGQPDYAVRQELPINVEDIGYELYPKNGDQMWAAYKKYCLNYDFYDDVIVQRAIENTYLIGHERIEEFFPDTSVKLPDFVIPPGETADSALRKMAFEGLRLKGLQEKQEYQDRLERELTVVEKRQFSKYFLTMRAVIDRATKNQLVSTARGSAGGALLSYCLGITKVDPIRWGLQFERFMTEDTSGGFADIDIDIQLPMELKDQLIEEWGDTTVVPISNWNTLQFKTLIKDIARFYDIPFEEANLITKKMDLEAIPRAKAAKNIEFGVYNPTFEEYKQYSESLQDFFKRHPQVATHIENLHGSLKSNSRHASGTIIGENLDYCMPMINSKGVRQTPWSEGNNVRHLEPLGFIKFDLLGLDTLNIISECIKKVLVTYFGNKHPTFEDVRAFYDERLHPDKIDFNELKVWKSVFHAGRFPSIFQFTETNVQEFCKQVKPTSIEDLSAITAIYRPGALSARVHEKFIDARKNPKSVKHPHPLIAEILKDTHYMIYQEHIASIASAMGKDISLAEGNMLRKVLTKKGTGKTEKVKKELYSKFVDGCVEKGLTKIQADDIWKSMEFYSGYGFNKSHSVAYSMVSYQCAWLFTHYEPEWLASFLDHEPEKSKADAISMARSFGYKIKEIDINQSEKTWTLSKTEPKTLVQPLLSIKGLGEIAIDQMLVAREHGLFTNVESLLFNEHISYSKFNKKALDVLFRAGAVNSILDKRFSGLKHAWSACVVDRPRKIDKLHENIELYRPEGEFSLLETVSHFFELTGRFPLDMIVDEKVLELLKKKYINPISNYDKNLQFVWGIPISQEIKKTKAKGKEYLVVTLIDNSFKTTQVRCWGINSKKDVIHRYALYVLSPTYKPEWGFSTTGYVKSSWKCIKQLK